MSTNAGTYQYDGAAWQRIAAGVNRTQDIALTTDGDVFVVTRGNPGGRVLRLDGSSWSEMLAVGRSGACYRYGSLNAIWASASDDIFVVGPTESCSYVDGVTVYHYDGTSWKNIGPWGSAEAMYTVWGSSSTDVFMGGSWGSIYLSLPNNP
ncbi:MAG: hypothetical protein V3V49_01470 [Candidatus Krumholzibacteria bacterium]